MFLEGISRPPFSFKKSSGRTDGESYCQPNNIIETFFFIENILVSIQRSFIFLQEMVEERTKMHQIKKIIEEELLVSENTYGYGKIRSNRIYI